ncbi:MAG: hypothetical protein HQM16_04660 [Deltaproteobacteria bacterium]|nr:hypothetical protein [Deltaproteobacteria bacterium]
MEYVLSRFKIIPGKKERTESFLKHLHENHQREMADVMKEAKMMLDCSFVESNVHGDFLYIFKKLENHNQLIDHIENSKQEIYSQIRSWAKECVEKVDDLSPVATFDLL